MTLKNDQLFFYNIRVYNIGTYYIEAMMYPETGRLKIQLEHWKITKYYEFTVDNKYIHLINPHTIWKLLTGTYIWSPL